MSEARSQTYTELYLKLDTKDDENDIYKMTKFRKRKMKDFNKVKCIKDETDRLSVKYDEIKNINRYNTLTKYSMKRVRKLRLSWMIHLLT
jgi:hypothetical protein